MKRVLALLLFITFSGASRASADSELPKAFFETKDRFEQLQLIERLTIRNVSDDDDSASDELIAETSTTQKLAAAID